MILTWRTILLKWLVAIVSKSANWGYSLSKWPKWLINGGYHLLINWDDPPSRIWHGDEKVLKPPPSGFECRSNITNSHWHGLPSIVYAPNLTRWRFVNTPSNTAHNTANPVHRNDICCTKNLLGQPDFLGILTGHRCSRGIAQPTCPLHAQCGKRPSVNHEPWFQEISNRTHWTDP